MIIAIFVVFVPGLIYKAAENHVDNRLEERKTELFRKMTRMGFLQFIPSEEDSTWSDYSIFKQNYSYIERAKNIERDTNVSESREIEGEIVDYRILRHYFKINSDYYVLEIGESLEYVESLNRILSRVALYILVFITTLTVLIDLSITNFLLRPMKKIESKLISSSHPEKFDFTPIKSSTSDFRYLDHTIIVMMQQIRDAFLIEKEFIANVSHELLTPVSILQTRLENMLESGNLDEPSEQKIIECQLTLGRLKQIIKSLLLISQIENNQTPKTDNISIPALIREVISEIDERFEEKNITLETDLKDDFTFRYCNRSLLFTMFFNIINNAIKYNRMNGNIRIASSLVKDTYEVIISDTGIGISPENLKSIFQRFKKFNSSESESYGLGLSMVKTIADFHAIRLMVDSKQDEGTVFTVQFRNNE